MRIGRTAVVAAMALAALGGCEQADREAVYSDGVDTAAEAPAEIAEAVSPEAGAPSAPRVASSAAQIAYAYRYVLALPAARAPVLLHSHEQACIAAGPATCQVLGTSTNQIGRDDLTAVLELRATPAYVARLRAGLERQAHDAGGRIVSSATDSEDLTRNLSDTEARLRALTTLRDRLQQLLATRSGSLDQLLQVERELARVQGEVDATQSALALMQARVATSRVTLEYQAEGVLAPDSALRPVSGALHNALSVFMNTLAGLILAVAALAPLVLIGTPIVWFVLRERRRRRARSAATGSAGT